MELKLCDSTQVFRGFVRGRELPTEYTLLRDQANQHRDNARTYSNQSREAYQRMDIDTANKLSRMEKEEVRHMRLKDEEAHVLIFTGPSHRWGNYLEMR